MLWVLTSNSREEGGERESERENYATNHPMIKLNLAYTQTPSTKRETKQHKLAFKISQYARHSSITTF